MPAALLDAMDTLDGALGIDVSEPKDPRDGASQGAEAPAARNGSTSTPD